VISVRNNGDANLDIEVLVANAIDDSFYFLFASVDPGTHRTSAIDDKHHVQALSGTHSSPQRLKPDEISIDSTNLRIEISNIFRFTI
jgi:hypothetical protein